jgi:hypothetical protein
MARRQASLDAMAERLRGEGMEAEGVRRGHYDEATLRDAFAAIRAGSARSR